MCALCRATVTCYVFSFVCSVVVNCLQCFKTVWHHEEHLVKKFHDEMLAWLSFCSKVQNFAYGPGDTTAMPSSLASLNPDLFKVSDTGLPILSWKKAVKQVYCLLCCNWFILLYLLKCH